MTKTAEAKPREFWIKQHGGGSWEPAFLVPGACGGEKEIHVREVLPGQITLTREQLRAAFENADAEFYVGDIDEIEKALFGEEG